MADAVTIFIVAANDHCFRRQDTCTLQPRLARTSNSWSLLSDRFNNSVFIDHATFDFSDRLVNFREWKFHAAMANVVRELGQRLLSKATCNLSYSTPTPLFCGRLLPIFHIHTVEKNRQNSFVATN